MEPYGGPHHAEVTYSAWSYLESQWMADQGFAVVVADGLGTPGSPSWERAVRFDLAKPALDGQVAALATAAAAYPGALDLGRVAIRGWSFGGYLGRTCRDPATRRLPCRCGRRPRHRLDAVRHGLHRALPRTASGAPGRLRRELAARRRGRKLERPLLIIHGLADDNVVAAHSLRLSSALLAAGRPHSLLPLSGVTHMTPQEVISENLLLLQVKFLRDALREPSKLSG